MAGFTRMKGNKNVLFIGNPIGNPIAGHGAQVFESSTSWRVML
jgi:hypothetical protein